MDRFLRSAGAYRLVFIDLDDYAPGVGDVARARGRLGPEVEPAALVHGRNLEYGHLLDVPGFFHVVKVGRAVADSGFLLQRDGPELVGRHVVLYGRVIRGRKRGADHPGEFAPVPVDIDEAFRVLDHLRQRRHGHRRVHHDVPELGSAPRERLVADDGLAVEKTVVHHVPRGYCPDGFVSRHELSVVFIFVRHDNLPMITLTAPARNRRCNIFTSPRSAPGPDRRGKSAW